jgi:hypothetical protein
VTWTVGATALGGRGARRVEAERGRLIVAKRPSPRASAQPELLFPAKKGSRSPEEIARAAVARAVTSSPTLHGRPRSWR